MVDKATVIREMAENCPTWSEAKAYWGVASRAYISANKWTGIYPFVSFDEWLAEHRRINQQEKDGHDE